jgi:outer membrane protein OmpA-like peptidoglycan-associated protein
MKQLLLTSAIMLTACIVVAQEVQWASKIIDFSSQLSEYQYSASQVLGKPNVLPESGDNPNAWLPSRPNRISFVKVGFEQPMKVRQIAIGESFNPGALYQVFLYDENDGEHLLNTFTPRPLNVGGRLLNIYLSETEFSVSAVKIVIDGSRVPGYNGIDAIGISGTTVPIVATKEVAFRRNPGLDNQFLSLGAEKGVSDSRPVFVKSTNTLYMTRGNSPENVEGMDDLGDIWQSVFNPSTEEFSTPVSLGESMNDIGYNSTNDVMVEGSQQIFLFGNISGKSNKIGENVVTIRRADGTWGDINEQKIKNARIGSFDADYTWAENGTVLIISTLRFDTEGARDLYISYQEADGRWSEPKNMGTSVNTTMDEYAPFYSESERSLYFATAGFPGFGGTDVFKVTRIGDSWDNWTPPENIGTDINTETNERYFFFDEEDDYAYFARMNPDSTYAIIRVERPKFLEKTPMVAVRGNVLNKETNRPVNSVISMLILPEERTYNMTISDETTGSYEVLVPSGNEYKLVSEREGYDVFETTIALENRNSEYAYTLDINMGLLALVPDEIIAETDEEPEEPEVRPAIVPEIERETIISDEAYEITFPFDSDKIDEESYPAIDFIVKFMNKFPDIVVELAGFTDQIGNEKYNFKLSIRRALSVRDYMVNKGIDQKRIRVMGFGEHMPIVEGETKQDLRMNRRVEYNFTR